MSSNTERVATSLHDRLSRLEWGVGEQLPPLAVLAASYDTSVPTIHRAQRILIDQGTLRAEPGIGVFVQHTPSSEADADEDLRQAVDQINEQIEAAMKALTAAKARVQALDSQINRSTA